MNADTKIVPAKRSLKSDLDDDDDAPKLPAPKAGLLPTGLSRAIVIGSLILGMLVTSLVFSHRFELVAAQRGENAFVYRIDTLTGHVSFCSSVACVPVSEKDGGS